MITFDKAIQAMLEGKKVRQLQWNPGFYCTIEQGYIVQLHPDYEEPIRKPLAANSPGQVWEIVE